MRMKLVAKPTRGMKFLPVFHQFKLISPYVGKMFGDGKRSSK